MLWHYSGNRSLTKKLADHELKVCRSFVAMRFLNFEVVFFAKHLEEKYFSQKPLLAKTMKYLTSPAKHGSETLGSLSGFQVETLEDVVTSNAGFWLVNDLELLDVRNEYSGSLAMTLWNCSSSVPPRFVAICCRTSFYFLYGGRHALILLLLFRLLSLHYDGN